jgi:ribonuclease PH
MKRPSGREPYQLRSLTLETHVAKYAEGSCLIKLGDTHVFCTATVEEKVPSFLKNTGSGWITAEYGMLPRSTLTRIDREAARGKQTGRTQEIQRLIGRSLRSIANLSLLGERQIHIDCDVIQADGGTRTASITAAYISLHLALQKLHREGIIAHFPLTDSLAAVSCGIYENTPILDLDYAEDSTADVDANFVLTGTGKIVEIQTTAEKYPFSEDKFLDLLKLAHLGIKELTGHQLEALRENK